MFLMDFIKLPSKKVSLEVYESTYQKYRVLVVFGELSLFSI